MAREGRETARRAYCSTNAPRSFGAKLESLETAADPSEQARVRPAAFQGVGDILINFETGEHVNNARALAKE